MPLHLPRPLLFHSLPVRLAASHTLLLVMPVPVHLPPPLLFGQVQLLPVLVGQLLDH